MTISIPTQIIGDIFPIASGAATNSVAANSGTNTTNGIMPANALFFANSICGGANDSFSSWIDNGGNSYNTSLTTTSGVNSGLALINLILLAQLASGSTFTAVTSDLSSWGMGNGYYVTGAAGGLDTHTVANSDVAANSVSMSTGVLAQTSEIVIGVFNCASGVGTWTEASGFTTLHNDGFNITSYQIVSSTSSVTWNPSWTTGTTFNAVLASFKATQSTSSVSGSAERYLGWYAAA